MKKVNALLSAVAVVAIVAGAVASHARAFTTLYLPLNEGDKKCPVESHAFLTSVSGNVISATTIQGADCQPVTVINRID